MQRKNCTFGRPDSFSLLACLVTLCKKSMCLIVFSNKASMLHCSEKTKTKEMSKREYSRSF